MARRARRVYDEPLLQVRDEMSTMRKEKAGVDAEHGGSDDEAGTTGLNGLDSRPLPRPIKKARKGLSRAEKSEENARRIFAAAFLVVGREGYAEASVSKITAKAKVAAGTFYNYFESRQDLFDQLLPTLGNELLSSIRAACGASTGLERERRRIVAYFEFCEKNPGFLRILNEAEVFSPKAFNQHLSNVAAGYARALHRSHERGEMPGIMEDEIEPFIYMLMGARSYVTYLWLAAPPAVRPQRAKQLADAYVKLAERALFGT